MTLKEQYKRFREWQRTPFHYENHNADSVQHCANCETEFSDNYCPRCGQKAGLGKVSWQTVRQGILLLWGMDSRSLAYSLLQLFLRPGQLISEYISGRRQVSFPPVKMLFIMTVIMLLLEKILNSEPDYESGKMARDYLDITIDWFAANPGWGMMIISVILMLPTWFMFHNSPRHTRHSLPEGFFIQVFMSTIIIAVTIITDIFYWVPLIPWIALSIPVYFFVVYKYLFGYGWWGTLWRLIVCVSLVLLVLCIVMIVINYPLEVYDSKHQKAVVIAGTMFFVIILVVLAVTYCINRWTEKKRIS